MPIYSAQGRVHVLLSLFLAGLVLALFGSSVGAATLKPTPANAPHDYEALWKDGCFAWSFSQTVPKDSCVFGDKSSSFKVAIVGDSHTSDLFGAFKHIAMLHHWKLYAFVKADCPFIDMPIYNAADQSQKYPQCGTWNSNVLAQLQKIKPNLTITVPFRWIFPVDRSRGSATSTGKGIGRMLARLTGKKVVIVDTPYAGYDVPSCVAAHGASHCRIPESSVLSGGVRTRERAAASVAGGKYIDLTDQLCAGYPCRVVTGNILEFRDGHHLTNTYGKSLYGIINTALMKALS